MTAVEPTPFEGTSFSRQAVFAFAVEGLGGELRLKQKQAAPKSMNEEHAASGEAWSYCTGTIGKNLKYDTPLSVTFEILPT